MWDGLEKTYLFVVKTSAITSVMRASIFDDRPSERKYMSS
jgi:hypothetical protein